MRRSAIVVVALALLSAACGGGESNPGVQQEAPVTITGDPLPRMPQSGADPAQGMTMPELRGESFDGTPVSISNDGRPKILLFLAHW